MGVSVKMPAHQDRRHLLTGGEERRDLDCPFLRAFKKLTAVNAVQLAFFVLPTIEQLTMPKVNGR